MNQTFQERQQKIEDELNTGLYENQSKEGLLEIIDKEHLYKIYRVVDGNLLIPQFLNENELVFWYDVEEKCWCCGSTSERRSIRSGTVRKEKNYIDALKMLINRSRLQKRLDDYEREELKKQYGIE